MKKFELKNGKSGKREVAGALLILWGFVSGYVFFWIPTADVAAYREVYSTVTTAVMMFAGGAFGLDFYMKNRDRDFGQQDLGGSAPGVGT